MRYAVISDIHGNMPALEAVLKDAENRNADSYIFLGDYYMSLPFPNEVVNAIRSTGHSHIIRGNEEDHIGRLSGQNQDNWTDGQFSALYWTYRTLTKENRAYLSALPAKEVIDDAGARIFADHSSKAHFHHTALDDINSRAFALNNYKNMDFIHGILNTDKPLQNSLSPLPDGIYLFGHTHLQFHKKIENKLLINPGSCGLPLDRTQGAPYTMIDIVNGDWQVNEYRVLYDLHETIRSLRQSELYHRAKVWSDIIIDELYTAEEKASFFLNYADRFAKEINDPMRPYSPQTWEKAYKSWRDKQRIDHPASKS